MKMNDVEDLANMIIDEQQKQKKDESVSDSSQPQEENNTKKENYKEKGRIWTIVAYPEHFKSVEYLISKLAEMGLRGCVSPLHDRDLNSDGTPKKAHWHIMLIWNNPTTYANVKTIADELHSPIPKKVHVKEGMWRYCAHLDNPEKAQYNIKDIKYFGGCSEDDFSNAYKSNRQYLQEVLDYIIENEVFYYDQLIDLLSRDESKGIMYVDYVANHTLTFNTYLQNRRYRKRDNVLIHRDTGELLE